MKNFKLFTLAVLLTAFSGLGFAQIAPSSTTLTASTPAANGSSVAAAVNTLYVASTTGMLGQTSLGAYQNWAYVDGEAFPIVSVPSTTSVQVLRGSGTDTLGTVSQAHISGATLTFGPMNIFLQGVGLINPNGLGTVDPQGSCLAANYTYLPLINTANGHRITCDAISSTASVFARTGFSAVISGVVCGPLATTTTVADDGMVPVATNNVAHKFVTTTTGGTVEYTCVISPASLGLSSGSGAIITGVSFFYGVQGTGGFSSIAAATVGSVTGPAPGGTAKGTVASAGGTLTVTPASLQTAVTTLGLYYNELVSFGTPFYANTQYQTLTFDQVFTNSTTVLTMQIPYLIVFYDQPS
jgi:hypothetical protein